MKKLRGVYPPPEPIPPVIWGKQCDRCGEPANHEMRLPYPSNAQIWFCHEHWQQHADYMLGLEDGCRAAQFGLRRSRNTGRSEGYKRGYEAAYAGMKGLMS